MVKEISFENTDEMRNFLLYERDEMYDMTIEAIKRSFELAMDDAYIAVFYLREEDLHIYTLSHKSNWNESLTFALEYFVKVEEYEKCAKIKTLMEDIRVVC